MHQILDKLFRIAPDLSPKLKHVAKLILDRPNVVATTSMRAFAKQAGVTPPTMIRLANELGFEHYDDFRQVFQSAVNDQPIESRASYQQFEKRANRLQQSSEAGGIESIISELTKSAHSNIEDYYQHIDFDKIGKAADMIIDASTVYVVAAGGAHWMAAYLQYVGNMAVPHLRVPRTSGNGLVEGLIAIKEGDVILTMSYNPYAKQAIDASRFALSRGARMIYLTDSKAAPLASEADILLLQKTTSPQFYPSMVSVVLAIEALIAVVVARSGESAIRAIADYTEMRKNNEFMS